jgi:hypothetical protein
MMHFNLGWNEGSMSYSVKTFFFGMCLVSLSCALGITALREIMLAKLREKVDTSLYFKFPRLGWNFLEIKQLYRAAYPKSKALTMVQVLNIIFVVSSVLAGGTILCSILWRAAVAAH